MRFPFLPAAALLLLAACAGQGQSQAQAADAAACTQAADQAYQQTTLDQQARTSQNGLMYGATPNHVFDAETMGAQSQRLDEINRCETYGNQNGTHTVNGVPVVAPHIVN